jgi:hypothetical protein
VRFENKNVFFYFEKIALVLNFGVVGLDPGSSDRFAKAPMKTISFVHDIAFILDESANIS